MRSKTRSKKAKAAKPAGLFEEKAPEPVLVGIKRRTGIMQIYALPPETRVKLHPSGYGFIATHPDHKEAIWCKPNMTTEVHTK
jgi:hypothetical protein